MDQTTNLEERQLIKELREIHKPSQPQKKYVGTHEDIQELNKFQSLISKDPYLGIKEN